MVALVRKPNVELGRADAWITIPIVKVEDSGENIDLEMDPSQTRPGLTVSQFFERLDACLPDGADRSVFAYGDWEAIPEGNGLRMRRDLPVVAAVRSDVLQHLGVAVWFEGWEGVFRSVLCRSAQDAMIRARN